MSEEKNVGKIDQIIRVILGIAVIAVIVYWFAMEKFMPWFGLIPLFILIPFFLKTGLTRVCPIMKSMGISTNK